MRYNTVDAEVFLMVVWKKRFEASYRREDGLVVLHDADVPLPDDFEYDTVHRSNVVLPPGARGGDHYHQEREEVFVGFGEGLELLVEDPQTKNLQVFKMDPKHNDGKCVAFWMQTGMPHAVRNTSETTGYLLEFASAPQETVPYPVAQDEILT